MSGFQYFLISCCHPLLHSGDAEERRFPVRPEATRVFSYPRDARRSQRSAAAACTTAINEIHDQEYYDQDYGH